MENCYEIKNAEELMNYLKSQGRNPILDIDYQLKTNHGNVHELPNGEVVFFDNHFAYKAILFKDKKCFDSIIKDDKFPIENPQPDMFELEGERIESFQLQADHYKQHLNAVLKFDFPEITKEAAHAYLKKVIGRAIKNLTTSTDIVALISVIGELVKAETNGRWFLKKRYGTYNPFYEPNMVTGEGHIFLITDHVLGCVKWKTSKLDNIFNSVHSKLIQQIKWENYSNGRNDMIVLE